MFLSFISSFSSFDFASLFDGSSSANTVNLPREAHDWNSIRHQFKFEVRWAEIYFLLVNKWIIRSVLLPRKELLRAWQFFHSVLTANCAAVQFTSEAGNRYTEAKLCAEYRSYEFHVFTNC